MLEKRIAELLAFAYGGEVIGVHLFEALAHHPWSTGREAGLRVAADLERQTRLMLEPLLLSRGISGMTDADGALAARDYVARFTEKLWSDWCTALAEWSAEAREKFLELLSLVPADEREQITQLVNHEDALIAYARASSADNEIAGMDALMQHIRAF